MTVLRRLSQSDYTVFDDYLRQHAATSMFMRSNALKAGLEPGDQRYQAHYFGAFKDAVMLEGVIALNWNGNIFTQADDATILSKLIAYAAAEYPVYIVQGVLAPEWQAKIMRDYLGADGSSYKMNEVDTVYSLELNDLILPQPLTDGSVTIRTLREDDLDEVAAWNVAYEVEALGEDPDKPGMLQEQRDDLIAHLGKGDRFVLTDNGGRLLSKASFNAQLPNIVQIGGVFTPPALRGRGYGRAAVAGILDSARNQGVGSAVLFTNVPAAANAYQAIGFERAGDYSLCLLKQGFTLG